MGVLTAAGVVAGYHAADQVLNGAGFEVASGEIACIIGPNGAGKSTLLKVVAGLLRPRAGTVTLDGRAIQGRAPREISTLGIAFVPQEHNIFSGLSVQENLEMGGFVDPRGTRARAARILDRFPVLAEKRGHAARTLSGGQRQVLAMAMALMVEPAVLLLDEPSAGLAPRAAEQLFDTVTAIKRQGVAIAMVEQNAREALAIADRAYIVVDGRNSRSGPAAELAADPEVRRLFLGA